MKKIMWVLMGSLLLGGLAQAGWEASDVTAYEAAKKAGNDADAAGDLEKAAAEFKKAAELAGKAEATTAQAWRLNNAAFALIRSFKAKVDYATVVPALEGMAPSAEKMAKIQTVAETFKANTAPIDEAGQLLEQAKGLGVEAAQGVIDSNMAFVSWVKSFPGESAAEMTEKAPAPAVEEAMPAGQ